MLRRWVYHAGLLAAVALCYHNALQCDFVFDDISAVKDNRDLRPHTPLTNLLHNDFWGTPMEKVGVATAVCPRAEGRSIMYSTTGDASTEPAGPASAKIPARQALWRS